MVSPLAGYLLVIHMYAAKGRRFLHVNLQGTGEPMMTMVCHLMTFEGERPLPSLPPTTVPATESLPVYELQEALHRASNLDVSPLLPQHLPFSHLPIQPS